MEYHKSKLQNLLMLIAPLLLFVLTPFLVALHVYFPNAAEFSVPAQHLVGVLLPVLGIVFIFLLAVLALLPATFKFYFTCLIAALGLLFWVQGYILNWEYGVLTGAPIPWAEHGLRLVIDILVWLSVIAFFVIFARKISPYLVFISCMLLFIQGVSLFIAYYEKYSETAASPSDQLRFQQYTISEDKSMDFSRDKNIVIIMLDAFQSDVFQEIIDNNLEYYSVFDGFTYFRNTTAQYSKTYGAIPALLTGKLYKNKQPIQEFLSESFQESISTYLMQEGWSSQLFPMVPRIIGYSENYASNIRPRTDKSATMKNAGKLLDIGLFRISPQFFKPFWLNDFQWRLKNVFSCFDKIDIELSSLSSSDNTFFHPIQKFAHESLVELNDNNIQPTFKFFHFNIPHEPFVLNEDLEHERLPSNRNGFRRYSKAGLEAVRIFIDQLKANEMYEQTMIIVASDHGGGEYDPGILDHDDVQTQNGKIPAAHHESGLPLLLVKPFNNSGKLKIIDAPASLKDILVTICNALGLDQDYDGFDLFSLTEDTHRVRRYIFYEFKGWEPAYLPDMLEYEVSGHAWSPASWSPTGHVYSPAEDITAQSGQELDFSYNLDAIIDFSRSGQSSQYLVHGWGDQEESHRWTVGEEARMFIEVVDAIEEDLIFRINADAYQGPDNLGQEVDMFVNGIQVATWEINEHDWYEALIPAEIIDDNHLSITFIIHEPIAPCAVDESLDSRKLGIIVLMFQLMERSQFL